MKKKLLLTAQILVSAGLLVWLFQQKTLRAQIGQVLSEAHPAWLALGFIIAGVGQVLGIWRWGIYVKMLALPVKDGEIMRIGWVGALFNNFLIGAIGGDAVKVLCLATRGSKKSLALLSIAMDRLSGVVGLIAVSLVFMYGRMDWLKKSTAMAGLIEFILAFLVLMVALLVLSYFMAKYGMARRIPAWAPGRTKAIEFEAGYGQFFAHWPQTLLASVYSVIIFMVYFLTFYCAARAFQVNVPLMDFFAIMPTVDIVSALPVSVAGFGVREHLFTVLLGDLSGVPAAQAVLISLAGALLTMIWGLVGLVALPEYRKSETAQRV